jgi:hypothetical protein
MADDEDERDEDGDDEIVGARPVDDDEVLSIERRRMRLEKLAGSLSAAFFRAELGVTLLGLVVIAIGGYTALQTSTNVVGTTTYPHAPAVSA